MMTMALTIAISMSQVVMAATKMFVVIALDADGVQWFYAGSVGSEFAQRMWAAGVVAFATMPASHSATASGCASGRDVAREVLAFARVVALECVKVIDFVDFARSAKIMVAADDAGVKMILRSTPARVTIMKPLMRKHLVGSAR